MENQVRSLRRAGCSITVLHIDGARSKIEYLRGAVRLLREASNDHFDIVHAHYGLTGVIGTLQRRLPLVVTYLGSDVFYSLHRGFSLYAAHRADCNVVMSHAMRKALAPLPCVVIPNGTDVEQFNYVDPADARRSLGWPTDEFAVLFPWNPTRPEKNYGLATASVDYARSLGASGIRLLSFYGKSQPEYNLALNASDMCLLTSHWEGSPNAVRESLAVGLPVVSVPAGDTPKVLEGIPYCHVLPRDHAVLGKAIYELFRQRTRLGQPLRHDGRHRALEYSLGSVAVKLTKLYEMILGGIRDTAELEEGL